MSRLLHAPCRHFYHFLQQQPRRSLLLLFAGMLLAAFSEGLGISLLMPILTRFQHGAEVVGLPLPVLLAGFLLLQLLRIGLQYRNEYESHRLQATVVDSLREQCFQAVMQSRWNWLAQRDNAQLANLLLTDINRTGLALQFFLQWSSGVLLLLAYVAAALWLSPGLTALVLLCGTSLAVLHRRLQRDAMQLGTRMGQTSQTLHRAVQESLAGIKLAKILGSEQRHLALFEASLAGFRHLHRRFVHDSARARAQTQAASVLMLMLMLYTGLQWWQMPLAKLGTLVFIFSRLMPMAMQALQQWQQWVFHLAAIGSTQDLLAECQKHAEPLVHDGSMTLQQQLSLQQVGYTYPGRDLPALRNICLTIPYGSTVAIIGQSGAGKSTLADVIMGLLQADSGTVSVDGQALDAAACQRWRRSVAYVPQDCFLFNDTIRHNLQWAAPQASDDVLWQVLDQAAAGFVRQLPQGLDTVVGDHGLRLSGGERQRIALARALLGKPALLLLDEATSALDTANEELIRQAIVNLHGQLTVVAIGHRLATLQHADQVVVIAGGEIVAQGPWSQIPSAWRADDPTTAAARG